ncbi:MAG: alpha/beta hydrolase [Pseudomonadota bacterium]
MSLPAREDIEFKSKGETCRGWYYPPHGAKLDGGKAPAILMSHGFSAVKELLLENYAKRFHEAGFAVMVFDYRFLGASDGEPRYQVIPTEQHDDIRAGLAWLSDRPEVDADRIGYWGSSYGGGHALFVGAQDPRIKVIVSQVPVVDCAETFKAIVGHDGLKEVFAQVAMAQTEYVLKGEHAMIPVVAPEGEPCVLATPDSYDFMTKTAADIAPSWKNLVTVESLGRMAEYDAAHFMELIAPRPLLIVAAAQDSIIPVSQIQKAFDRVDGPKHLEVIDCGHFEVYSTEPYHEQAVSTMVDWYETHL